MASSAILLALALSSLASNNPFGSAGSHVGVIQLPVGAAGTSTSAAPPILLATDLLVEARASISSGHGPASHGMSAPVPSVAAPPASAGISLAYDAADGYVVALAPNVTVTANSTAAYGNISDTWKFVSGNWTHLNLSSGPPNRNFASISYDATDRVVVLFGGAHLGGTYGFLGYLGDTWTYVNATWTNVTGTAGSAPSPRAYAPMVWDASDGYTLLFGGCCGVSGNSSTTTEWGFVNGTWTSYTSTGAGPQNEGALAYDSADGVVLYFGGAYSWGGLSNETWSYHAGSWSSLVSSVKGAPPPRALASMAYDPALGEVVLFGGNGPYPASWHMTNDTWMYLNLSWTLLSNASGPSPRYQSAMVYDNADSELVLFGGVNQTQAYSDTWVIAAGNNSSSGWTEAAPVFGARLVTTDVGVATTLTVHASLGGSAETYAYTGLPPGCASVNAPTIRCDPSQSGLYLVEVTISSSAGTAGAFTHLLVNPAPSVASLTANPASTEVGRSFTVTAVVSGGTGALSYDYSGLPSGCSTANRSTLACTPAAAGSFTVRLSVIDNVGGGALASAAVTVVPGPSIGSVRVSPSAIDLTQWVTISIQASGGIAPYTVITSGLPSGCDALVAMSVTCQPSTTGAFPLTFTLTDHFGVTASGSATLVVNAWPAITSFAPSPTQVVNGSSVTFVAGTTGGTGGLTYVYYGLPSGCASVNRSTLTCAPTEVGNFTIEVAVADDVGGTTSAFSTLQVVPSPILPPPHHTGGPGGGSSSSASASSLPPAEAFSMGAAIGIVALAILAGREIWRQRIAREGRAVVQALRDRDHADVGPPAPTNAHADSDRPHR
jgi:hypothetical protein